MSARAALPLEPRRYRESRLSPDGRFIAVTLDESSDDERLAVHIDRETFLRFTPRGESTRTPVWSPDGLRLAFWSATEKGLFTRRVHDVAGSPTCLTRSEERLQYPNAWSADGTLLVCLEDAPHLDLYLVATDPPPDVRPVSVGPAGDVAPVWGAPDTVATPDVWSAIGQGRVRVAVNGVKPVRYTLCPSHLGNAPRSCVQVCSDRPGPNSMTSSPAM